LISSRPGRGGADVREDVFEDQKLAVIGSVGTFHGGDDVGEDGAAEGVGVVV